MLDDSRFRSEELHLKKLENAREEKLVLLQQQKLQHENEQMVIQAKIEKMKLKKKLLDEGFTEAEIESCYDVSGESKNNIVTQETIIPTNLYKEQVVNLNDNDDSDDSDDEIDDSEDEEDN